MKQLNPDDVLSGPCTTLTKAERDARTKACKWRLAPFSRASLPPEFLTPARMRERLQAMNSGIAVTDELVYRTIERLARDVVWLNDTYQVNVSQGEPLAEGFPAFVHLSIKRIDKEPIHDWRDLQEIKNMLVGPEHEGFEIYPAESRCVDTANQYHLWVFTDPEVRLPVGWLDSIKLDTGGKDGSKQRPFDKESADAA